MATASNEATMVCISKVVPSKAQDDSLQALRLALNDRAAELAEHLLGPPNPKFRRSGELRWGTHGSLLVHVSGDKGGLWCNFESQESGDLFGLIMVELGCSFRSAIDLARNFVGNAVPAPRPRQPRPKPQKPAPNAWSRIWRESVEPTGTLVETYLAARSLSLPEGTAGTVVRFHAALWHDGGTRPGMVCLFRDIATNEPCGVHRTFFDSDGRKFDRRMLGRAARAAVKLSADEDVEQGLHVGEGVETCIAAMLAGYRPTWALGSAGGIAKFPLLAAVEAISVLSERNDGGANEHAVAELGERCADREVLVIEPLVGDDINDAWSGDHAAR
jgi:hypothetical protein